MWSKVRCVFPQGSLLLFVLHLLIPGLCFAGEGHGGIPLSNAALSEVRTRTEEFLVSAGAGSWDLCGRLVNGNRAGAVVFIQAGQSVDTLLSAKLNLWIQKLGIGPDATGDEIEEVLNSLEWGEASQNPEEAEAILGLTSALYFVKRLSSQQREEQIEIRGYGEHPLFAALNDVLSPSADPDDIYDSLFRLKLHDNRDYLPLAHFSDALNYVTGMSFEFTPDFLARPGLPSVLNN